MRKVILSFLRKVGFINCLFILLMMDFRTNAETRKQTFSARFNSETKIAQITRGHYLVVGSFIFLKNAQAYTKSLNEIYHDVLMAYYPGNKHYYVYLYESKNISDLRPKREKIRRIDDFKDAWILSLGENKATATRGNQQVVIYEEKSATNTAVNKNSKTNSAKTEDTKAEAEKPAEVIKPGMKAVPLYMNVTSATTLKEVAGKIKLVFNGNDNLSDVIEAHQAKQVQVPISGMQEAQLICDVFGYKKVSQDINFANPVNENTKSFTQLSKDTIIVNFELVRYKKGEVFTMFNVFFFNDAAVMLQKSTYELNALVEMVKENPKLKIKLHGHTNGNDYGRLIRLAPNDNDYFNIKPTNIQGKGSAKDLSFARADVIRRYLMEQGIDAGRILYKGWGGSKPIYPTDSPDASKNVRVEVEILND